MCCAVFIDNSAVNETCKKGCNSKLKFTVKATGLGKNAKAAGRDCQKKCTVPLGKRMKACGDMCNVKIVRSRSIGKKAKVCYLCNNDPGAAVGLCSKVVLDLQKGCKDTFLSSTALKTSAGFLVFASRTATEAFQGDKSQCPLVGKVFKSSSSEQRR